MTVKYAGSSWWNCQCDFHFILFSQSTQTHTYTWS